MATKKDNPSGADYSKLIREQAREVDVESFQKRGLKKVSVINAKQINDLVARAVDNAITRLEYSDIGQLKADKDKVIMESLDEFRKLVKDQQSSAGVAPSKDEVEALREELRRSQNTGGAVVSDEMRELKAYLMSLQAKAAQERFESDTVAEQERALMAADLAEVKQMLAETAGGNGPNAALNQQLDGLKSELRAAIEQSLADTVDRRIEEERRELGGALSEIKGLLTTSASAAGAVSNQAIEMLSARMESLQTAVAQVQTRPATLDPASLEIMMKTAMSAMKNDIMRDFEKGGVLKSTPVTSDMDTSIASSVVNSVFKSMESGDTQANLDGAAKMHKASGGAKSLSALEKLKQMKKK